MSTATHFNDLSAAAIKRAFPDAEVFENGDCGSVWGEYHDAPSCPFPHVYVKDAPDGLLEYFTGLYSYGAVVTDMDDWSVVIEDRGWVEDDQCPYRVGEDHRKPYVARI